MGIQYRSSALPHSFAFSDNSPVFFSSKDSPAEWCPGVRSASLHSQEAVGWSPIVYSGAGGVCSALYEVNNYIETWLFLSSWWKLSSNGWLPSVYNLPIGGFASSWGVFWIRWVYLPSPVDLPVHLLVLLRVLVSIGGLLFYLEEDYLSSSVISQLAGLMLQPGPVMRTGSHSAGPGCLLHLDVVSGWG